MTVLCGVCTELISKYKCSICFCPFCSVNCWKKHKSKNNCKIEKTLQESTNEQYSINKIKYFTEDTVSEDKLSQLGACEELKKILKNKYLQKTLTAIDNASNPEEAIYEAMKDPEFVEFVDACLKIVENSND